MSLGKKVILLLVIFIFLIVYTLIDFDYSKFENSSSTKIELQDNIKSLPTQEISNIFDDLKTLALTNFNKIFSSNENQEIEDKKEPTKPKETQEETQKEPEPKKVDKEKVQKDEVSTKEIKQQEVKQQEPVNKKEETKKPKIEKVSTREIQKSIDKILKEQKIVFQRRSTKITNASYSSVKKIANILKKYEKIDIEVAGHTDSRGADALNKRISQDRANSVKQTLINLGVKNRLEAVGYGEKFPIAKDDANGLSKENRRVEINITGDNR
ncbi:MAG: OmpA family protein [Campylobacterota bacterium]